MIPRSVIPKILLPLVGLGIVWVLSQCITAYMNASASTTPRRDDSVYKAIVTQAYPYMKDTFSVSNVSILKHSWAVVEIKNLQNGDMLRTLIYDPLHSDKGMLIVSAPSTRTDFDSLASDVNITTTGYSDATK